MKRKIQDYLRAWKDSSGRKSLIILGARQTGKTYAVNEFSKGYENYLYINFELSEDAKTLFNGDLNADNVIMRGFGEII
ncbi:MAG: AAA family ATPase [Candidatus Methanoplasma sp.]|jgi:predicted AAA+ superfamily ATPase|nr:AAA family ATPase [Candidatus Methanoplasma sp.]